MTSEPTILRKTYSAAYVLDRGKLSRMLTILEQGLQRISTVREMSFEVTFQSGKQLVLRSAAELFGLDNTIKNPITALAIRTPPAEDGDDSETRVQLHFDSDRQANISIIVLSSDIRAANEIFAELEEQIDRTLVRSWVTRYFKSGFLGLFVPLVMMTLSFGVVIAVASPEKRRLSRKTVSALRDSLASAQTDSDKINALVAAKVEELGLLLPPGAEWLQFDAIFTWRAAFIAFPTLVLFGTLLYMVVFCYPWAVFAWGDFEQHYNELITRRRTLGTVVVAALVIGVLGNLFVMSIPLQRP